VRGKGVIRSDNCFIFSFHLMRFENERLFCILHAIWISLFRHSRHLLSGINLNFGDGYPPTTAGMTLIE
jgi:hypothetical protein